MATVTSPMRQPFGVVDPARLRNLGNTKNLQNAMSSAGPKSLKRAHDSTPDFFDTENVDPNMLSPKKAKGSIFGTPQNPHFVLKQTSTPSFNSRRIITPKKLSKKLSDIKPVSFSAPAATTNPAGRSPKSKRVGILSKHRTSGFGRVDPPTFGLNSGAPFSIDAALSGTVSSYKSSKPLTLDEATPKGWIFEIHEDTPEEELGNLVQHSTQTLDISDDETKTKERDERGKENIPPDTLAVTVPISRRDAMTDIRTPLGDLVPSDFYAEGCDANSYIIMDEDAKPNSTVEKVTSPTPTPTEPTTNQDVWKELLAQVDQKQETQQQEPIEIWESESAKGDTEPEKQEVVATTTTLEECMAVAEAREEQAISASSS